MKRNRLALLVLLMICVAIPAFSSEELRVQNGVETLSVYTKDGKRIPTRSAKIASSGYILKSGDSMSVLTSDYGDIYIKPNTVLVTTGFNLEAPSLYLVDGEINIVVNSKFTTPLTVYTATTSSALSAAGEYAFVYTEDVDCVYNFSELAVSTYDDITKKDGIIDTYCYTDFINQKQNVSATRDEYLAVSVLPYGEIQITPDVPTIGKTRVSVMVLPPTPLFSTPKRRRIPEVPTLAKVTTRPFVDAVPLAPSSITVKTITPIAPETPKIYTTRINSEIDAPIVWAVYPRASQNI